MKNIAFLLLGLLYFASACTDEELDPFQLDKITKGSIISLRGPAVDNLNDLSFKGAIDKFSLAGDPSAETFEFDAAYLSDDLNSLQQVEVYARRTETGPRVRLTTIPGSNFTIRSDIDDKYPSAFISIPLNDILSALGITLGDIAANEYLFIESDLTLTDGTLVPSSAIVNSSLYESDLFYPAHKLRYLAIP
jgi:hypothetical protein